MIMIELAAEWLVSRFERCVYWLTTTGDQRAMIDAALKEKADG
jgi:hypothetical protein